jgi:hypothetical protein
VNPQYEAHERLCKSIGDMATENNELKQRIAHLEDIISRASRRFFRDGSNGMVARGMLAILEEKRSKP